MRPLVYIGLALILTIALAWVLAGWVGQVVGSHIRS